MRHLDRQDAPDTVWHISSRVNWQAWHLGNEPAYRVFTDCFRRATDRFAMDRFSFVLMSNHFHAALRSPPKAIYRELTGRRTKCRHFRPYPKGHPKATVIGQCLKHLKVAVAKRIQDSLELHGHFWDGKHFRRKLVDAADLVIAVAYDHRNPVRQGMVARPEDYPRSSAAWWENGGPTALPLCQRPDLPFGISLEEFREDLRRYQRDKRLDDVMEVLQKSGLSLSTPAGRVELARRMREAGLEPPPDLEHPATRAQQATRTHRSGVREGGDDAQQQCDAS